MAVKILDILAAYNDPACDKLSSIQKEAAGCGSSGNAFESGINIVNVGIGLVAVIAVIMIIIGGISYVTSSGDASKAKKARDTIIYGLIGLAIAILAFAIVAFVSQAVS